MSRLRQVSKADPNDPVLRNGTAYYAIYNAVLEQKGLIHGRLDGAHGEHCAIGSLWAATPVALPSDLIDEVAAVNDSMPKATPRQRKARVATWLRWKLGQLGLGPITSAPRKS